MILEAWGILLMMILAIVVGAFHGRKRRAQRATLWAATAAKLGGTFHSTDEIIRFPILDLPAMLLEVTEVDEVATAVQVDLRGRSRGSLKIHRAWLEDSRYVMTSEPESLAHRIFSPERRASITRALREASVSSVDLTPERLLLKLDSVNLTQREMLALAAAAVDLVGAVLGREVAGLTPELTEFRAFRGHCLVCRGPLQERVVECRRCRTPHHLECWRYARRCSTYGCREDRFVAER